MIEGVKRITLTEKEVLWQNVLKEFPSDLMLRNLHFTQELMTAIRKRADEVMSYSEIGLIVRK